MNSLSNLDETYREYSPAPVDDLIRFCRLKIMVTAGFYKWPSHPHLLVLNNFVVNFAKIKLLWVWSVVLSVSVCWSEMWACLAVSSPRRSASPRRSRSRHSSRSQSSKSRSKSRSGSRKYVPSYCSVSWWIFLDVCEFCLMNRGSLRRHIC